MLHDTSSKIEELQSLINELKHKQAAYQDLRAMCDLCKKTNTTTLVFAAQAAKILECTESFLAHLRHRKSRPRFHRVAGKIKYDLVELLDYIDSCKNELAAQGVTQ